MKPRMQEVSSFLKTNNSVQVTWISCFEIIFWTIMKNIGVRIGEVFEEQTKYWFSPKQTKVVPRGWRVHFRRHWLRWMFTHPLPFQITGVSMVCSTIFIRRRSKKTPKLRVTSLCEGNPSVTGGSPHKGPVTRKMFPFDYVIMRQFPMQRTTKSSSTWPDLSISVCLRKKHPGCNTDCQKNILRCKIVLHAKRYIADLKKMMFMPVTFYQT